MSFKELALARSYNSDDDNIVQDFYLPVLSEANRYDRLAGFFSSTSLAVAARGIAAFIRNKGHIRMVVSPRLSHANLDVISRVGEGRIEHIMLAELENLEDEFIRDHVHALGWLLARGRLEIRVALLCDETGNLVATDKTGGIFHQKVGILEDLEGNILTFSGSVNETASAWLGNIEEFKVFKNWDPGQLAYVISAEKTVVTLAESTENYVTDGDAYILEDATSDEPNAAIFSKCDLTINGNGSLTVNANYNNGIQSKDDLKITGGDITVNAVNDGIKGRDSIAVKDGNIKVKAGGDGLQSNNDEDPEGGTSPLMAAL